MLKYQNSPYFSQQNFIPNAPSSSSLVYVYTDSPSQPIDQNYSAYSYSPQYFQKNNFVPIQKPVKVERYPAYQKIPAYSPMSYYNAYMPAMEGEKLGIPYLEKNPSYHSTYSWKHPSFQELTAQDRSESNVDIDQYLSLSSPSRENYTSNDSEDCYDLPSYNSPDQDSSDSYKSRGIHGVGRPPKRNSSAKSYHNRTLDNDFFDEKDEKLLLELAPKYKNDWKKISKRMFRLNNKKFGLNFLRIKYKELADDNVKKRVRFTHKEDLMIAKYSQIYGHDWTKIAFYFTNRTPIMLKNRYYHMKKKNILDKLVKEVEELEKGNVNIDRIGEDPKELLQVFTSHEDGLSMGSKRIPVPSSSFDVNDYNPEGQLSDTVTSSLPKQDTDQSTSQQGFSSLPPEEGPTPYEFQIYERPTTIQEAQIDENQDPQAMSLLEKIERPEEPRNEEPFGYPKSVPEFPEELPKLPMFNEDDEDWFIKGVNKKVSDA